MSRPDFSNLSTKKPRNTDVATSQLGQHTEVEPTTAEGPAMAHPRTDVPPAAPPPQTKPLPTWLKWFVLGALVALVLGMWVIIHVRSSAEPAPAPLPNSTATPAALPQDQQAQEGSRRTYQSWSESYTSAINSSFDANKLDSSAVTPEILNTVKSQLAVAQSKLVPAGVSGRYLEDTRSMKVLESTPTNATLEVCAVRVLQYLKDGKDTTVDPEGRPRPVNTTPTAQSVMLSKSTGGNWVITSLNLDPDAGKPC